MTDYGYSPEWVRMSCSTRGSAGMVLSRFPRETVDTRDGHPKSVFVHVDAVVTVTDWAAEEMLISAYVWKVTRERAARLIEAVTNDPACSMGDV